MVPDRIEREISIDAPVERVWDVITQGEHVGKWFGDVTAEIDLRPGGRFTCTWAEHGTVFGIVERVERPRVFAYRWARPLGAEVQSGNSTLVEFTLVPDGTGTRLTVVESGFRDLDLTDEERAKYAAGNVEGWKSELNELVEYLAMQAA
ncbi:MAG TPA: SRPBCC family protein [Gemmatimonadaceae bacterium]|jgi:uncharacterized protein YndB with AHSA1/START domain|nr:SRPBCC family protein [Gemmatimonadaceae bacterium]